jgi:nucleoside-diphosphate-sugar epimerase
VADDLHVIFGTGAAGLALMDELLARDVRVRLVNRSGTAPVPPDVEVVGGDAADHGFAARAAAGASVVYQCLGLPYDRWVEEFPPLQDSVVAAAATNEAKLVVLENCYMYGPPGGKHLTEHHEYAATTRKGMVRADMSRAVMEAHESGRVRAAIGRASDFFGPRAGRVSMLGDRVVPAALEGRTAQVIGDPDLPHTYTFLPDIGLGLATLGAHDAALGQVWHLPNPDTRTTRRIVEMIFEEAGHRPRLKAASRMQLRLAGARNREVRELLEMMYEFEEPFIVSSAKFEDTFGLRGTKLREAVRRTVAWYRAKQSR